MAISKLDLALTRHMIGDDPEEMTLLQKALLKKVSGDVGLSELQKAVVEYVSGEHLKHEIFKLHEDQEAIIHFTPEELDAVNLLVFIVYDKLVREVEEDHPIFQSGGYFDILDNVYNKLQDTDFTFKDKKIS